MRVNHSLVEAKMVVIVETSSLCMLCGVKSSSNIRTYIFMYVYKSNPRPLNEINNI